MQDLTPKRLTIDEAEKDPQLQARKMFIELDHPDGKIKQVGISIKLSDTPGEIRKFPPKKGQHTAQVLKELGYCEKEIDKLKEKQITS